MPDPKEKDALLNKITQWKSESENLRSTYDYRWAKNLKLFRGVYNEEESQKSRVRNRSKIFFRKIWATNWRLVASFYNAFLRDVDIFKIDGRGPEDVQRARVLHFMTQYRYDLMMREQSLFIKFLWAFFNITNLGSAVGKLCWEYNEEYGKDGPVFTLYPNEQVYPDMSAETKEQMRYITFVNYLTKDDMEELGYENIDEAEATSVPSNTLRQARHEGKTDPLQNPKDNEYPRPGAYEDNRRDSLSGQRYEVWETFYREKGKIKFCVTNAGKVWLKKPIDSPYGKRYPVVMGLCLTEAHKLFGEGFPEPLEGPQESLNAILNMRKDNVALSLNKGAIVQRSGNVDLQSLVNRRIGSITLTNDVNAVKFDDVPDVTQTAYIEASADEGMMAEMSGVTAAKQGLETASKATVAQINFSESNAKIDLYISIVGETFVRDFFSQLAYLIQKFETNERVYRIANDKFRTENKSPYATDVYDLDFDADCVVNVGMGTVGRDMEVKQTLLAMDRAIMANQSLIQLLGTGAVPQDGLRLFDTTKFMEFLLPKVGYKNVNEFFFQVPAPMPMGGEGNGINAGLTGRIQPQIGAADMMNSANQLQMGSFGGI